VEELSSMVQLYAVAVQLMYIWVYSPPSTALMLVCAEQCSRNSYLTTATLPHGTSSLTLPPSYL
jgi:hypothetical protein